MHVIAGDRDGVELRHLVGGVFDDVGDDLHGGLGRIDIGVPHHEFLEDVVLDGAGQFGAVHTLLFARDDETGKDRNDCAVHRHGNADFFQRDTIKEDLHVLDRVNRHTGLADVTLHAGVVAVIAAVRCQIKRDRDALLPCGQRTAVESVGFLGSRETRILADRPRTACIHRGLDAARVWPLPRNPTQMADAFQILGCIKWRDVDALKRLPRQIIERAAPQLALSQFAPVVLGAVFRCVGHGSVLLSVPPLAG